MSSSVSPSRERTRRAAGAIPPPRLRAEGEAAAGPWPTLVLRVAAIYGPGRGLHVALRTGARPRVDDVDRVVSRVHVDDLASLGLAALASDLAGAFPVADQEPASSREVARFCEELGLPPIRLDGEPGGAGAWRVRRVDGMAILAHLGVLTTRRWRAAPRSWGGVGARIGSPRARRSSWRVAPHRRSTATASARRVPYSGSARRKWATERSMTSGRETLARLPAMLATSRARASASMTR